jgi:hypothetical protein
VHERLGLHTLSQNVASFREDKLARRPAAGCCGFKVLDPNTGESKWKKQRASACWERSHR